MKEDTLRQALEVATSAAQEAGKELIKHYGQVEAEAKHDSGSEAHDIVTKLDRQTEQFLSKKLREFDPSFGFRGEEFGVENEANITWLVDPIDGTSHFVRGMPFCTTMIALIVDGTVMLSVIHDFVRNDTYSAIRGFGAFKNNERIHVSTRPMHQAIVSFEVNLDKPGNLEAYLKLRKLVGGMISTVNCGFEFAMLASGKLDARITKDPYGYDWDFAPGSLLVEEAGGIIRNLGTDTYAYTDHDFIAANTTIYEHLTRKDIALFEKQVH